MVDRDVVCLPPGRPIAPMGLRPVPEAGAARVAVPVGPGQFVDAARPAEPTAERYPVARAKVTPPPLHESTLSRDRLLDWLEQRVHRRCITVVAETGFGKTTLLVDFTRRTGARCLWYRLDTGDRDPISFAHYLVAACREHWPAFGIQTLALLRELLTTPPATDLILATLISELSSIADRTTLLVLDDYHVVDQDPRARAVVTRLLAEAPDRMSLVLLSRRPPRLSLGRLVARGEAPRLDADDLRFSPDETERLFRDVYHQPLEAEVLRQVEARTEGWAAGLQLLHSSIRGRSPREVRSFVEAISGAEGPLYDYLAEEVLADFEPEVQRFLTLTSILDDVTIELAAAIFAVDDPAPDRRTLEGWADLGHQAGLMTRHSALGAARRYHPLMREFLDRRLHQLVPPDEVRAMHLRVARAAEDTDWLASCRHYVKAGCEADATRVLAANAAKVLGSGQWGDGAELIRSLRASDKDPRIAAILAREDIYAGRIQAAVSRLEPFDLAELDGPTRGLLVQARIHALWWLGRTCEVIPLLNASLADSQISGIQRNLLEAAHALFFASQDGSLSVAESALESLLAALESQGLNFYSAITYHNLLYVYLTQGRTDLAINAGTEAIELFQRLRKIPDEAFSTHIALARAFATAGNWNAVEDAVSRGLAGKGVGTVERELEAANLRIILGDQRAARTLIESARAVSPDVQDRLTSLFRLTLARLAVASGAALDCLSLLQAPAHEVGTLEPGIRLEWILLKAIACLQLRREREAEALLTEGESLAQRQGANPHVARFALLASLLKGPHAVDRYWSQASEFDLLTTADGLVAYLHRVPISELGSVIESHADRWLPLLRAVVASDGHPAIAQAAGLLDEHGELSDVPLLRALSRSRIRALRGTDVGKSLARKRSPRLTVHDLGAMRLAIGDREIAVTNMRRRAAGLLCYLLTRKNHVAPRDQVLDALWPELEPAAAVNSLNQTLYFLRRDIDPAYDDDFSPAYVHFESDLVWLDSALVTADSAEFHGRVAAMASDAVDVDAGLQALTLYHGCFAPEFEYEEWASSWRDLLHAQYLHIGEMLVAHLISIQALRRAADVAVRVLTVDPAAEHLERELIWIYGALGARAAAAEQYGHYSEAQRSEYGVEPPSFESLVASR